MPSISNVHIDVALTGAVIEQGRHTFIADEILPPLSVSKQSGKIFEVDSALEGWRVESDKRAPGAPAHLIDFDVNSTKTYFCDSHAQKAHVSDEEKAQADEPIRPYLDKTRYIVDKLRLNREVNLVTALAATLTSGLTSSPSDKWDDYTSGDPLNDLADKILAIKDSSAGVRPNRLAMDSTVLDKICRHPDFIDRAKHTLTPGSYSGTDAQAKMLADLLGLEKVVVADISLKNTAAKGQTASVSGVWGENVLLYRYEAPSAGFMGLGMQPTWTSGMSGMGVAGFEVERYRHPERDRKTDVVFAQWYYDMFITKGTTAHWFTNTLT